MYDRPVLIIDSLNLYMRAFCAYPQMSSHGYHMGGCIGFLKTLQKLVYEQQPSAVFIAWEGGGSARRRKLFSEYKLNRKPEKLNRFYGTDLPDSEENRKYQIITLLSMLKCVPVCQLYVSDCEGDDVIAYLCKGPLKDEHKVVASSDKDLYQLLNDKMKIYNLHKKTFVLQENVLEEYGISTQNFALAKAICGDSSDNIPGVKGLGFKTAAKKFPFLALGQEVLLQDVLDYSQAHRDESSIYKRVNEYENDLKRNWRLVYLDGSMLSATQMALVDRLIEVHEPKVDRSGLVKCLVKDGIGDFDVEGFFYVFNCIEGLKHKTGG